MQDLILVISRCLAKRGSVKTKKVYYRFHFKGFYLGEKIKMIHLYTSENFHEQNLTKGEDYLLWVKKMRVSKEILEVELIKHKIIN